MRFRIPARFRILQTIPEVSTSLEDFATVVGLTEKRIGHTT
jgi:hypothetical protein